jgi:hypothetical protein
VTMVGLEGKYSFGSCLVRWSSTGPMGPNSRKKVIIGDTNIRNFARAMNQTVTLRPVLSPCSDNLSNFER